MPRKGAATAAKPKPTENVGSEETADEVAYNESVAEQEDKPARPARNRSKAADTTPENGFEDWTKPAYASNPGEFEFGSLDDEIEYLSVLWWGKEGTGKTTNLARVAASKLVKSGDTVGRVLIINAEGGAKKTPLRHHGIDTGQIVTYPKQGQPLTFEGLERLFYRLQADLEDDPKSWAAVGWDSITAIIEKLLDDVIEADIRKTAEILQRAKKGREGRSGNLTLRDRFEMDGDDYAAMSNQVRLLLRKYRTLPCHFLVTALERRDEDKKRKTVKTQYGPAVNPALATALLGYVDVAIRTQVLDDGTYYGRTTPTEDSRGKDRMFSLPVEMVDPTFDRIQAYVRGDLKHETDPAQKRMPNGAEGVLTRRSLEDELDGGTYGPTEEDRLGPHHTKDGTPDGEPLAGDEDDPEPPKARATGRRSRASSVEATAVGSASESASTNDAAEAEPPKATSGRRARGASASAAGAKPAAASGRKTAAQRAAETAKAEVQADTVPAKSGPATRAASQRAKAASSGGGFNDEPPF